MPRRACAEYGTWNPFIKELSGEQVVGSRLRAKIAPPGQAGMVFKPVVLILEPPKRFLWRGSALGASPAACGAEPTTHEEPQLRAATRRAQASRATTASRSRRWTAASPAGARARGAARCVAALCSADLTARHGACNERRTPAAPRRRLVHSEEFQGCLSGLFALLFEKNSTTGFELMNAALKTRAEAAAAAAQ